MLAPKGTAVIVSSTVTLLLWVFSGVVVLPDKIVHNIPVVGPAGEAHVSFSTLLCCYVSSLSSWPWQSPQLSPAAWPWSS